VAPVLVDGFVNKKAFKPCLETPLTVSGTFQMSASSQVCSRSLAIIHFVLRGRSYPFSCGQLLSSCLAEFIPPHALLYEEIEFNVADRRSLSQYQDIAMTVAKRIQ
jgi:hypothetical protein